MDEVKRALRDMLPREAKILQRQVTKDVAEAIAEEAKANMPKDTGGMAAGTKAVQEKDSGGQARSTVRVSKAFYWRFLEYGDGPDGIEHAMFLKAREKVLADVDRIALDAFKRRLIARIEKAAGR